MMEINSRRLFVVTGFVLGSTQSRAGATMNTEEAQLTGANREGRCNEMGIDLHRIIVLVFKRDGFIGLD